LLLHAAGRAWIAAIATSHTGFERLATPLILSGAGIAVVMPTVSHESIGSVPASYVGVASGINSIRELGGVFGVALLADIFTRPDVSTNPARRVGLLRRPMGRGGALAGRRAGSLVGRRASPGNTGSAVACRRHPGSRQRLGHRRSPKSLSLPTGRLDRYAHQSESWVPDAPCPPVDQLGSVPRSWPVFPLRSARPTTAPPVCPIASGSQSRYEAAAVKPDVRRFL
jgi:hypothetical protein